MLCLGYTLPAALEQDFVRLERLPSLALAGFVLAGECDLDAVPVLKTLRIFAVLTDERRVILGWDLENFGRLVGLREDHQLKFHEGEQTPTSLSACDKIRFLASSTFSFRPVI